MLTMATDVALQYVHARAAKRIMVENLSTLAFCVAAADILVAAANSPWLGDTDAGATEEAPPGECTYLPKAN